MSRPIELKPHAVVIDAPRELLIQMLTSFQRGSIPGEESETSKLLSEDGDTKIVEFTTKVGPMTYTTVEEVTVHQPDRIVFRHLEGPLQFAEEEFTFEQAKNGGTVMCHTGRFIWNRFPFFGWFGGIVYTRPVFHSVIRRHLATVKKAAEARAAHSHVFRRSESSRV